MKGSNKFDYDMPSTISKRCATFGLGSRFGNNGYKTDAPPPGSYTLKS